MATMRIDEGNLPLAIGLSIGSGLATSVGGLTVFIEVFNRSSQATILSSALAVSAGVMLYVSFLEIFVKANDALEAQLEEGTALAVTTLCFFGGMGLTALLEVLVHYLNHVTGSPHSHGLPDEPAARSSTQLSEVQLEAGGGTRAGGDGAAAGHGQSHGNAHLSDLEPTDKKELMRTSTLTALAIALHNFPEGLATFIATLAEPSLGVALAVAIAVHNVPEGMAVAMPVYYSSGSKMKGFLWASLSGLTEPIGGILGWLALRSILTDLGFGIVFAVVGGMMVFIVIHEMMPVAVRYQPSGNHTTGLIVLGMFVMALSIVLFGL